MNVDDATKLCKAIASIAPSQRFDDETPAIWAVILADVRYEDARQAVINLADKLRFIAPADIAAEVKALRAKRLEGVDRLGHLAETPEQWREIIRRVADGELEVPPLALDIPANREAIEATIRDVFPRPPKPLPIDHVRPALPPAPTVSPEQSAAMEAERAKQQAEIQSLIESEHEGAAS